MAESDKEVLSLYQLIGAPLMAVVQAEAQAAQASADFIKEVGFERAKAPATGTAATPEPVTTLQDGGNIGDLKMVQFTHEVRGTDGIVRTHQMNVPVLSLFPIPLLQVKDAEFDFAIRILDHVARGPQLPTKTQPESKGQADLTEFLSKNRVELKGAIARQPAPSSNQRTTDLQLRVKIRMEQADMPAGLMKLLSVLDQGISSAPAPPASPPPAAGNGNP